jgi:gluconokinase
MSHVLEEVVDGFEPLPELASVMAASRLPVVLALDIGTSGIRAAFFDERGEEIEGATVRRDFSSTTLADLGAADADGLVEQVAEALDALFLKHFESITRVELIAVSCFWHSLVGINESGEATTPVLGWADSRSAAAAHQLRTKLDETRFHSRTGCRFHPSYWPAKLLRLKNEEPETFAQTRRWLSFSEYLSLRFFGDMAASVSMCSGTGLLDQWTCEWQPELLEALGLRVEQLPSIASPGQTFHKLTDDYALRWPQLSEAVLFPAIGDGAANNIGAGCSTRKKVGVMIGTSGAMRILYAGEPPDKLATELWCYRADRRRVLLGGALSDGGNLHNWIKTELLRDYDSESIENELASLDADAHGLTILPFWSGERSTGWNPDALGAILGLTLRTRPIEILRAAMEAVAYRFALIARALAPHIGDATIVCSGHALKSSPTWVQILADVLGRRVGLSELPEASTRGAALLALEAAGKIRSIEEFSVPVETIFEPDWSRHARYQAGLERQQKIYDQLITKTNYIRTVK